MASSVRTVTKALAAEEDLLYGEGTAQQTRAGVSYPVSKIRGFRPVNDATELAELDFAKFPKAVLVRNGAVQFFQHNGTAYEELVLLKKTEVITANISSFSAIAKSTVIFSVGSTQSITDITNGIVGQELNVISTTANTTIENTASIVLKGGANYLIPANTGLRLIYTGTVWAEV
jgi:hypothetical protein